MPKHAPPSTRTARLLRQMRRLRGRHIAALWVLTALLLVVTNEQTPTGTTGALVHWIVAVPLSILPIAVLTLWIIAHRTPRSPSSRTP